MTNLNKKITGIFKMKNLFTKNYWAMKGLALLVLVVMGGSVRGQYWNGSLTSSNSGSISNLTSVFGSGNNNGTTTLITSSSVSSGYITASGVSASGLSNFGAAVFVQPLSTSTSTYFSITITPVSTYAVTLSSINFAHRGTSTGPILITAYSSIDNYTTAIGSTSAVNTSAWTASNINFTSGTLTGSASSVVTLRLYCSNGSGSASANTANFRLDDVTLIASASIPATIPSAPTINSITSGNTQLSVAFTSGSDGGSAITSYKYSTDGGTTFRTRASGTTASPIVITTLSSDGTTALTNGTSYNVQIKAVNTIGEGTATSSTAATPLTTPTLITPTANTITSTSATLGATITSNGGASITARGTSYKTSSPVIASDNQLAEGGTFVASYSHSRTSLSPQTLYYYAGYATNSAGTSLSAEGSFRTLSSPPTLQSSVVNATVVSNTQINLAISPATFPNSGATSGGYVVIYSTGTPTLSSTNASIPAAGVGTIFVTSPTTLSTTQPSTSINVTGLSAATTYNFLIVPYTYDGSNAATYNYLTTSAPTVSVTTLTTATNFYSFSTGDLNNTATWGTNTNGTGTPPTDFISANQYFNVRNNATPTISSDWTISGINTKVIVDATIVLTIPITKSFTIGVGATLENNGSITNNGTLTIKSDATGTARIGTSAGTITGNVTVERYLPATRRAYRFLAAPVTTTGGVYASWQESGTNAAGLGIQVTGFASATPGVDATSGLDKTLTGNSSMFSYNGTTWLPVTDTKLTQLTPGAGFRVLVRGDRTTDLYASSTPNPTATTIKATGTVGQGTITLNGLLDGFNLIGNPYPSSIDWIASGWQIARTASNVNNAIYIYNPAEVAATTMTYPAYVNGVGTNGGNNIIRSGQAFFVHAAAAGASISFSEAYKSTEVTGGFFRSATPEMMRITYMQNNEHLDDIVIRYNDDVQADFDPRFDAISMGGDANGLASFKNADRLAIHTRPTAVGEDSIALSVRNTATGNYQLKFSEMEGFATSTDITLLDKFLNVQYDVKQDSIVNFDITTDVNSKGDDRFWLFYNHKSTGINQQALAKNKISVYPNPASSVINLSLKLAANQKSTYTYSIYNQLGAMVQAGEVDFANGKQAQINIDAFSAGVYFITASNGKDLQTIKFVK